MDGVNHIAVIMDGNRRYARKQGKQPWEGHYAGAKKIKEFLEWCREFEIKEVTLYAFSVQNFNRPEKEKSKIFEMFSNQLDEFIRSDELNKRDIRLRFIGRISMFPEQIQSKMRKLSDSTKSNTSYKLNLAMAYGGREEIVDAVNKIIKDGNATENIDVSNFSRYLYLDSDPDMVIRTGNAYRTSNFLPWQTIYSEWFFLEKTWPEFTKEDFKRCLEEFGSRERRFGK